MTSKFAQGIRVNILTMVRDPVNITLAVILPAIVIEGWGRAMADLPALPNAQAISLDVGRLMGATLGVALIAGLLGLAQVISAREADRRLVQTGFAAEELLATRLLTLIGVTIVVASINYSVLLVRISPEAPVLTLAFLAVAGITYAFIGVLIGAALPRLFEGSLVIAFMTMMDAFLGESPLSAEVPDYVHYFPLNHPKDLVQDAAFAGTYETGDLVFIGAYLVVLLALVVGVFRRTMEPKAG